MLPPILEVFVVWHPYDETGKKVADHLIEHFHGSMFTGLIGGAVDVYPRSQGWTGPMSAPRPIGSPGHPQPTGVRPAAHVAVVPVLGPELARELEEPGTTWWPYLAELAHRPGITVLPLLAMPGRGSGRVSELFDGRQDLGTVQEGTQAPFPWLRNLAQALTQLVNRSDAQLQIFISHTRQPASDALAAQDLTDLVRQVIAETRLGQFFDANNLQSGQDWRRDLAHHAARLPMLALRTDRYTSRSWCQKEVQLAKTHGAPLVILDALQSGESRGSFLMDHVPRVRVRGEDGWSRQDVEAGLGVLVDETLKRALWREQQALAAERLGLEVAWWAPHAPEPVTLTAWLLGGSGAAAVRAQGPLRILHPDPPLGPPEQQALADLLQLRGIGGRLDVMTPRQLAARGG